MERALGARRRSALSKFFIAAGILIILALFTALLGPLFVDWTSYRASFERAASDYVGRPVTITGKVNMRLLPTPVVSFTDVSVGEADTPDVEMEQFRAEIELAALLKGQIRIIQMTVERPLFHFDVAGLMANADTSVAHWKLDPDRISLDRLQVIDGSAAVVDSRSGRKWRAEDIDAIVEAETLVGPGKVNATMVVDGKSVEVSVGLGRLGTNSVPAKISVRSPAYPVALAADGVFQFPGAIAAKYEGTATVEGVAPRDPNAPHSPWMDFRSSGKFELTPSDIHIDKTQISYGGTERPLILEASGGLSFADAPHFQASLSARQFDLDQTLGGSAEKPVSIEGSFAALADALPALVLPPIPGKLHLDAEGVVLGGSVMQSVSADVATADGAWSIENFAAELPGETNIAVSGTLGVDARPAFRGHARVTSKRPSAFEAWWRGETGTAGQIGRFGIDADLDLGPESERISNLVATTGTGTVEGSLDVRRFPQTGQLFVNVDLAADRADLVETRALAELFAGNTIGSGKIDQMTLKLRADVLSAGGVEAKSVIVEGGLEEGGDFNLRKLSVADLAGATIDALGSIHDPFGTPSGNIEASVKAADFRGAADFLASFAPESDLAQRLKAVAPILSPVNAEVSAESGDKLALSLTGSFADTHLTLEADGKGSLADLKSIAGKLTLHADGEDSVKVLRQLGLKPIPMRSTPIKVDASFEGALASAGKLVLNGTIAGVDLDYSAETTLRDGAVSLLGPFKATSKDIDPLLLFGGLAVPGVGEGHAASAAGLLSYSNEGLNLQIDKASFDGQPVTGNFQAAFSPDIALSGTLNLASASLPFLASLAIGSEPDLGGGGWSNTPFATDAQDISFDFGVNAATLDVGASTPATDAQFHFSLSDGALNLDILDAGFAGGTLKGAVAATLRNGEAEMSLRGGLAGADLQSLVWEEAGLPAASGKLDLSFEANGRGRSLSGVVATLNGAGSFSVDEGRLNALNGVALSTVMQAAEGEKEPDENKARETFAQLFGSGALAFGRAAGGFTVADGEVSIPTVSVADNATTILGDAKFDLHALTLSSNWVVRAVGGGDEAAQPFVNVRFSGPIAAPERAIDLDPLLNRLRSRFLQRQLDELETAQAAARERIEEGRQAAADRRDRDIFTSLVAPTPTVAPAPAEAPPEPALTPEPAPIVVPAPVIAPAPAPPETATATPPAMPSVAATPLPPTLLDPDSFLGPDSPVQVGPDLPPPETQASPEPLPEPSTPRRVRKPAPVAPAAPIAPPLEPPAPSFDTEYKTLPNGTIVKIR